MLRGGHERAIGGGQAVISLALAPRAALLCIKHTRMVYSWTELLNTTKHHNPALTSSTSSYAMMASSVEMLATARLHTAE